MRLLDRDGVAGPGLVLPGKGRVEVLVLFAGRVARHLEQGDIGSGGRLRQQRDRDQAYFFCNICVLFRR
jgi:hypothetical protein